MNFVLVQLSFQFGFEMGWWIAVPPLKYFHRSLTFQICCYLFLLTLKNSEIFEFSEVVSFIFFFPFLFWALDLYLRVDILLKQPKGPSIKDVCTSLVIFDPPPLVCSCLHLADSPPPPTLMRTWFPAKFLLGRYIYPEFPWFWKWDSQMKLINFFMLWFPFINCAQGPALSAILLTDGYRRVTDGYRRVTDDYRGVTNN